MGTTLTPAEEAAIATRQQQKKMIRVEEKYHNHALEELMSRQLNAANEQERRRFDLEIKKLHWHWMRRRDELSGRSRDSSATRAAIQDMENTTAELNQLYGLDLGVPAPLKIGDSIPSQGEGVERYGGFTGQTVLPEEEPLPLPEARTAAVSMALEKDEARKREAKKPTSVVGAGRLAVPGEM